MPQRPMLLYAVLIILALLYLFDGLSCLTSGFLFVVVLPAFSAILPSIDGTRTILLSLFILSLYLFFAIQAFELDDRNLKAPSKYLSTAKWVECCPIFLSSKDKFLMFCSTGRC